MKNKLLKRLLSFVLSLAIVFGMVPASSLNAFAAEDTVYISVSYDDKYIQDKNGNYIADVPVSFSALKAIDLGTYGLDDYIYDKDGNGDYEITALHLIIYAHEKLYGGSWSNVTFTGGPAHSYFEGGIFGFDENLNYFHNGTFPIDEKLSEANGYTTGATSDRIVLEPGDHIDMAAFSSWDFYGDSNYGFHKFADEDGKFAEEYSAVAGEETTVKLVRSYSGMGTGAEVYDESDYTVYYGTSYDNALGNVTTDGSGCATINFPSEGTYYIWCDGGYGCEFSGSIVSTPAYAVVNVEASSQPTPEPTPTPVPNNAPALAENYASGTGTATITAGEEYSLNLAEVFTDADGDTLKYFCNDTELADAVYTVAPAEAGTQTFVFKANDGKADSAVYTVTLTVTEPVKQPVKLESLIIYTGSQYTKSATIVGEEETSKICLFSPDILNYTIKNIPNDYSAAAELNFCAVPEEGCTATLYYGDKQMDITSQSGNFIKPEKFIVGGNNEFEIVVSSNSDDVEKTTYKFLMQAKPTLTDNSISHSDSSIGFILTNLKQTQNNPKGQIIIPNNITEYAINVTPYHPSYTVTYNDSTSNIINVSETEEVEIIVSKDGFSKNHTVTFIKVEPKKLYFNVSPDDAEIELTSSNNTEILPNSDGSYDVIFYKSGKTDKIKYNYTVLKDGYVTKTGEVTSFEGDSLTVDVELKKELPPQPSEVSDVDWKNFRNSDVNMAITSVQTPKDKVSFKWSTKLGTGWGAAPSVPIIVDNKIVVMSGRKLCMLDAQSGEIVKEAEMAAVPNFGYTPPTYANGMIFCPLTNGTVQAFNAATFESLWVYTDPYGGQALSPIAYSDGYIYTGFWNGESGEANYVCIDVTDYDDENDKEPKSAVWTHKQKGGFYWAGAVAVGDAVIVGTDDGGAEGTDAGSYLYSFNKKTGEIITKLALASDAGDQRSSIAYENGRIYFTTKGGYLYSADVNSDGTVADLKGVNYNAQITSTPVVYKGRVYFGIGSGIRTDGSEGSFVVAYAETLEKIFEIEMLGYPQGSALLSTAYEESEGMLYFYMTYNDRPGGISLIKVKTDAQTAADAQLVEIYDAAGFEEFSIASIVCGDDGTLYYKNDSGNFMAVATATAKTVINLIESIGTVTLESEAAIKAAREAYENLDEAEKAKVTNIDVLVAAEKELENFVKADEVDKLIQDIGSVTLNNGKRIKSAREAYNKLTEHQKTLVKNYERLLELEKEYNKLATEAVDKVEKLIDKIGDVDIDSTDDIADAKLAYNQLPDELKELVDNYDDLKAAEKELKKLREEALALLAEGKLVLTKTELLELKEDFEKVAENTGYNAVLALLHTFYKLGETQQLALENSDEVKLAQKIVAKHNHTNAYTGVKADGLEWNIRLAVEETDNETALNDIKAKLENSDILTIWDIYLEDVLTGKKYKPEEAVQLKIPSNLLGDYTVYDYLKVIHCTDDGRIELLNCEIADGYIVFNAAEFSWYGVVGFMNGEEEIVSDNFAEDAPLFISPQPEVQQNNSNPVVWIVIAAAGIAALAVLVVLKKRTADEE